MRPFAAVAFLLITTSALPAETPPTASSTTAPTTPSTGGTTAATTTATTTTTTATATTVKSKAATVDSKVPLAKSLPAKPPAKKEEPMGTIVGQEIARPNGTYLGLEVVDGNFKLSFYDKKKKPMAVDVTRATARWPNARAPIYPNRTVLNVNGNALVGQKPVIAPFNFNVSLVLLKGEGDDAVAVETYVIPFHG